MAYLTDAVAHRGARQHGAVTRHQLIAELDCKPTQVDRWLRNGSLRPAMFDGVRMMGVYTLPGAPDTPLRRIAVAWLRAGVGALVGGPTACALHGIEGFEVSGEVHVVVPPHRRVRGVPFTVTYRTVPNPDRARVHGFACLTPTRALIDAQPHVPARTLRVGLDDARRRGLVALERLARRVDGLGRTGGAPALRRLIGSGTLRHESEGERALARLFEGCGREPAYQVWVLPGIRVDAFYPEARLAIEYDGRDHHTIEADRDADSRRELRLKAAGIEVVRVTAAMLAEDFAATRERILRILAQRLASGVRPWSPAEPA